MRKQKLILTILSGLCALLWMVNIAIDAFNKEYLEQRSHFTFNAVMTGFWIVIFVAHIMQYRKMLKDEQADEK